MKIEICPRCEGTAEIKHDVGTHQSQYEYSRCTNCNDGKIIKTSVTFSPSLPYREENKSLLYKIDTEIHTTIREIYKKYNLKYYMTTYIHTATWKTHPNPKSPDPITKDSRGNEIVVGAKVAYNFSGAVAMGTITAIKNNVWKKPKQGYADWTCDFKLEIEHEDGNISMVKNPNSFIIL